MRRARFKLAPNVASASRASQTLKTEDTKTVADAEAATNDSTIATEVNDVSSSEKETVLTSVPSTSRVDHQQPQIIESTPAVTNPLLAAAIASPLLNSHTSNEELKGKKITSLTELSVSQPVEHQQTLTGVHRFKHRAKIRPVLHDGPHRIRTISSASESEDDAGRRFTRPPLSPVKKPVPSDDAIEQLEEDVKKSKARKPKREKTALDLKKEALKKKLARGNVDRSQLTMFDLIYYNPVEKDKPIRLPEKLQMRLKPYEAAALAQENANSKEKVADGADILEEKLAEEDEMTRLETGKEAEGELKVTEKQESEDNEDDEEDSSMPVPQLRLGPDGEIIIDDKSLYIDTTETKKNKKILQNSEVIIENSNTLVNYGSWSKRPKSSKWSLKETAQFYKALAMLGTNFSLMDKLFAKRDRTDLKRKFKHEEKVNRQLVDKILATQIPFDPSQFFETDAPNESDSDKDKTKETKKKSRKRKQATEETSKEGEEKSQGGSNISAKSKRKRSNISRSVVDSDSSEATDPLQVEENYTIADVGILSPHNEADETIADNQPVEVPATDTLEETATDTLEETATDPLEESTTDALEESTTDALEESTTDALEGTATDRLEQQENRRTNESESCTLSSEISNLKHEKRQDQIRQVDAAICEKKNDNSNEAQQNSEVPKETTPRFVEGEQPADTSKDGGVESEETSALTKPKPRLRGRIKPNLANVVRKPNEATNT